MCPSATPSSSARCEDAWMVGPSAMGSEKGTPSSITSAPFLARVKTISTDVLRSGSPAVTKGINPFRFRDLSCLNVSSIRLIKTRIPKSVRTPFRSCFCHSIYVFVTATGKVDDDNRVEWHFACDLDHMCNSVGGFQGGNDPLSFR